MPPQRLHCSKSLVFGSGIPATSGGGTAIRPVPLHAVNGFFCMPSSYSKEWPPRREVPRPPLLPLRLDLLGLDELRGGELEHGGRHAHRLAELLDDLTVLARLGSGEELPG